jgi:hypothetical protein
MGKTPVITQPEFLARLLAPVLVSAVAVLIQIRDGKDAKDIESAINEARRVIALAVPVEPPSGARKA